MSDGSEVQRGPVMYPPGFILAVAPDEVDRSLCEHEADDPVCACVHDWRIEWGNVSRRPKARATYIQ